MTTVVSEDEASSIATSAPAVVAEAVPAASVSAAAGIASRGEDERQITIPSNAAMTAIVAEEEAGSIATSSATVVAEAGPAACVSAAAVVASRGENERQMIQIAKLSLQSVATSVDSQEDDRNRVSWSRRGLPDESISIHTGISSSSDPAISSTSDPSIFLTSDPATPSTSNPGIFSTSDPAFPSTSDLSLSLTSFSHEHSLRPHKPDVLPPTESISNDVDYSGTDDDQSYVSSQVDSDDNPLMKEVKEILIDAQHAQLPGISSVFEWTEDFSQFTPRPEVFRGPAPGPTIAPITPYGAFVAIWDKGIMSRIVTETNRYADQKIFRMREQGNLGDQSHFHKWVPTCVDEMYVLFAMFMIMGISKRQSYVDVWVAEGPLKMPGFLSMMSFERFQLLKFFLHFANDEDPNAPANKHSYKFKLCKLGPVIDHLYNRFQELYNLDRYITVHDYPRLYINRAYWKRYMKSEYARFGIKCFALCCSKSGYVFRYHVYLRKSDDDNLLSIPNLDSALKKIKIVLRLLHGLEHRGHCVVMENYNSPALARYLKLKGFDHLGLLKVNRAHTPEVIKKLYRDRDSVPMLKTIGCHCGDVSVVTYNATKLVTIISTLHDDSITKGFLKEPVSGKMYRKVFDAVIRKNQKLTLYCMEKENETNSTVKMFLKFLNVSINNAHIIFSESQKKTDRPPMSHYEFRKLLANELAHRYSRCRTAVPIPQTPRLSRPDCSPLNMLRLSREVHIPRFITDRRGIERKVACVRCNIRNMGRGKVAKVDTKCETCDVPLCFKPCWTEWHSMPDIFPQSV